jgi:hypothetical protein
LETLGIENNHTMRVCRSDDQAQRNRFRELRSYSDPSLNDITKQTYYPQYQQQSYPTVYDQPQYNISPR